MAVGAAVASRNGKRVVKLSAKFEDPQGRAQWATSFTGS